MSEKQDTNNQNLKNSRFLQAYFNFWNNRLKFQNLVYSLDVDWQKPWWELLLKVKYYLLVPIIYNLLNNGISVYTPIWIGYILTNGVYWQFYLIFGLFIFRLVYLFWLNSYWIAAYDILGYSIKYNANKFFLTTDPIHHTTKASGKILSKVNRGEGGIIRIVEVATEQLLPTVVSLLMASTVFFVVDWYLGILTVIVMLILTIFYAWINYINTQAFQEEVVEVQDKFVQTEVETLSQTIYIRSIFATPEQIQKLDQNLKPMYYLPSKRVRSMQMIGYLIQIVYLFLLAYILYYTITKEVNLLILVGLITSFMANSYRILDFGRIIAKFSESVADVKGLFEFIRKFGPPSYPSGEGKLEG